MKIILETSERVRSAVIYVSGQTILIWHTFTEPNILKVIDLPNNKIDIIEKVQSYMGSIILTEIRDNMYRKRWTLPLSDLSHQDKVCLHNNDKEIECNIWCTLEISESTSVWLLLVLIYKLSENLIKPEEDNDETSKNITKTKEGNKLHIKVLKDSIEVLTEKYTYNITKSENSEIQVQVKNIGEESYKKNNVKIIKSVEYDDLVKFIRHIILRIDTK